MPDLGGPGPNPVDTGPIPIASDQNQSSPSTTSRQAMSMTCSLPDESLNPSLGLGFVKFWVAVEHFDLDLMVLGESFKDFEVLIYPPVLPSAYEILGSLVSSLSQNSCPSIGLVSTDPFTVHHGIANLKPDKPSQVMPTENPVEKMIWGTLARVNPGQVNLNPGQVTRL
jgi:hypothetical protein